jgi:hypothetical protein
MAGQGHVCAIWDCGRALPRKETNARDKVAREGMEAEAMGPSGPPTEHFPFNLVPPLVPRSNRRGLNR